MSFTHHAPRTTLRIASRGSALALAQANMVLAQCRAALPDESFEIKIIKTTGDKLQTASLASANLPKGLFTKELEAALLNGEADLAVHSLKDLPTELPAGLWLGAVSKRADVRDVLIYRSAECGVPSAESKGRAFGTGLGVRNLPRGATIATSSTRRRAQLLDLRPDLNTVEIRGNVGTRLRKLAEQSQLDAIILAAAGLERLHFRRGDSEGLEGDDVPKGLLATPISLDEMLPCVGQAALGIEIRDNDPRLAHVCRVLNDPATHQCVLAERAFLRGMGGGCQLAVAAHATLDGDRLHLRAISFLGARPVRGEKTGSSAAAEEVGSNLAKEITAHTARIS
jgi:hydroxymethylbilane synthase